jgi:hypothetical protein
MALTSGQLIINIGAPNSPTGSDSLLAAFSKIEDNFTNVFTEASSFTAANVATGPGLSNTVASGTITIVNSGVTGIVAGTNLAASAPNGAVTLTLSPVITGLTSVATGTLAATGITSATVQATGNITGGNASVSGTVSAGNVSVTGTTTVGTVMKLTPLLTAPVSPTQGTIYYDGFMNMLRVYNGISWGNVALS